VVLAHWGFFGILLTAAELVIGIGLLLGIATRLAALGALVLIGPLWLMLLHTNTYLWEYPLDLFPLLLLAIVPAGAHRRTRPHPRRPLRPPLALLSVAGNRPGRAGPTNTTITGRRRTEV